MVAVSCRDVLLWSLSSGQAGDGPEGHMLIEAMAAMNAMMHLLRDSAYEGEETRAAAVARNVVPVVPANPQRKQPSLLEKHRYRQRNEVECVFRRIKAYERVFTRYDKLDVMFAAFTSIALICEHLR